MTPQNYFVLNAAQRTTAMGFNGEEVAVNPRMVDSASPGYGINTNDGAAGFDVGDGIALTGKYVAPVRIINDPDYLTHAASMVLFLQTLPSCLLESATVFLPDGV